MRLTGPGVFGPPPDRDDAVQLLRQAVEAGVDHIDTAEYYGHHVVNELIRQALHPYPTGLVLVSKVGARRDDRGGIFAYDEPAQLRLRTLDVDSLPVVNLRMMRASRPDSLFDDQLAAMTAVRDNGLIGAVGLSNVTLPHLLHALKSTEIACVQNAYHPPPTAAPSRCSRSAPDAASRSCRSRRSARAREMSAPPSAREVYFASPAAWTAHPHRLCWPGPCAPRRTSCSSPARRRGPMSARTSTL
jgi:hypothetical protein